MKSETKLKAFPYDPSHDVDSGMDLRDWFAGMALQGLLASGCLGKGTMADMVQYTSCIADEMMKAREESCGE